MLFILAVLDAKLADALTLMVVGMAVVFGSLVILLGVVTLLTYLAGPDKTPPKTFKKPADNTQLVAVLAAAATAALGKPVRVTDVQPASTPEK